MEISLWVSIQFASTESRGGVWLMTNHDADKVHIIHTIRATKFSNGAALYLL